ncbi:MAG: Fic family protein, partial [Holdemanella sp.]|nr:Fic family protein [Holdemanella sp.]
MSIKSKFYKLEENEFKEYLSHIKNTPDTMFFLQKEYFYSPNQTTNKKMLELNSLQYEFDFLVQSFSEFGKRQLLQGFMIDDIVSTNGIESIQSTRHDIFYCMNQLNRKKNDTITSIVNTYELLIKSGGIEIHSHNDVCRIYDFIMKGVLDKKDQPDGLYYRKSDVFITDGLKVIHSGLKGEGMIMEAMDAFIELYNSCLNVYEKMILCHFILESIHPFYDGNGRLGRFLFSNGI